MLNLSLGNPGSGCPTTGLLARYRGIISDGKLLALSGNHATQQVKGSGFFGAGSATVTGLLTTDTITATGTVPTCSVNGTLTFGVAADCWDVYVHRAGKLWAYWPGINMGQTTQLDESGNDNHLIPTGTTVTERLDGSGTNIINSIGYSSRQNNLKYTRVPSHAVWTKGGVTVATSGIDGILITDDSGVAGWNLRQSFVATSTTIKFGFIPVSISSDRYIEILLYNNTTAANIADVVKSGAQVTAAINSGVYLSALATSGVTIGNTITAYIYIATSAELAAGQSLEVKQPCVVYGDLDLASVFVHTTENRIVGRQSGAGSKSCYSGIVACIGDSITNAKYPIHLQRQLPVSLIVDYGVAGNKTADVLARLQTIIDSSPSLAMLLIGVNDCAAGLPLATIQANYSSIVTQLLAADIPVITGTITPWKDSAGWTTDKQAVTDQLNAWIPVYSESVGCAYVDLYTQWEDPSASDELLAIFDAGDKIHPSVFSAQSMAVVFEQAIPGNKIPADSVGMPIQYPGPLGLDATVVSGTTLADAVIKAPLGPKFQAIPEFTNNASVTLNLLTPTDQVYVGEKALLIYEDELSGSNDARATRYVGPAL